jgi:predicted nucleotidyltransferase
LYGLSEKDVQVIKSCLEKHPKIEQALIFGSRAIGSYRKGSDIDIALFGVQQSELEEVRAQISDYLNEESPLPYYFDILDYQKVTNPSLKVHIDSVGKLLYKKN